MVKHYMKTAEEQRRSIASRTGADTHKSLVPGNSLDDLLRAAGLATSRNAGARSNAEPRARSLRGLQSTYGNRAVQRYLRGSASSRPDLSVSVQREEEGGMWDYAQKLLGIDQISPAVNSVLKKTQSGVEHAGQKLFDWLMPSASAENMPALPGPAPAPGANEGPGVGFVPTGEDAPYIDAGDYAIWQNSYGHVL